MNSDEKWMRQALALAVRGQGHVHPNPMVGAVLVRGGRVVGAGYHRAFGRPHAEVEALQVAGKKAQGATLYVTLEPCSHWGKTPPCVEAVVQSGVRVVVAAMRDPNPRVAGRGFAALRKSGIRLRTGALESEAKRLNRAFMHWILKKTPYVTLKVAATLDGKIATASGESQWITSSAARQAGHRLRAEVDAIAVGVETVLRDNPGLTAHGQGCNPERFIFDSRLRTPLKARVLAEPASVWVLTTNRTSHAQRARFESKGVKVCVVPADRQGRVDVRAALRWLGQKGVAHLLVEGGGELLASFLESRAAHEVMWFLSPKIIGGKAAKPAIGGSGIQSLKKAWRLENLSIENVGEDLCIRGTVRGNT